MKPVFQAILMLSFLTFSSLAWAASAKDSNTVQVNKQTNPSVPQPASGQTTYSDPFEEMEQMQGSLNKVFRESFRRMRNYQQAGKFFEPDADFMELGSNYVLKVDLPGMTKDQISIEVSDNDIAVSGERKTERQVKTDKDGVFQFERSSGSFYRRMTLPTDANTTSISAKYENGVLEVTIPKLKSEIVGTKKVAVQ